MDDKSRSLLLDTHVWIWFLMGHPKYAGSSARALMDRALRESRVKISVFSVWEIGMLESKGRLSLPVSIQEWVRLTLEIPGVSLAPFTEDIAIESNSLPGDFHPDPADRILVATARRLGMDIVTADRDILEYSRKHYVRTVPV